MKKLGKRSSLESGTFFAYACNCNCGSVPCGTCNNCNDYKNPQSTGAYALSYVTEIFVLGVPGGILPITRRQPEHFGVSAFEVFNSVKPDYMIFNLYNADVESKYLSEIKMLMRYRFDVDIDAFYISNYIQDGLSLNTYMPIKYIRQEQHDVEEKWQKFGEGIYYKSKIALLVENLIQTLNGYKEIEIL